MKRIIELLGAAADVIVHRFKEGKTDIRPFHALFQMLAFRLTWTRRDLDYVPPGKLPPVFMSARAAAQQIPDGATVISTGIAGNSRCSTYYWAVRDRYERTGHPSGLTWMVVAGVGGRGKAPGTIEELGVEGLLRCHISGHLETHKALLQLGEEGKLELHAMPQGVMAHLIEAQRRGVREIASTVGKGTFLDPSLGGGTNVINKQGRNFVRSEGDGLVYTLPEIQVAVFSAPYADREGNIYFKNAALITENLDAAYAAKANGGRVLVTVCDIIEARPSEISIPASMVDAIAVNPRNEQTGGVLQRKYFPMFTEGARTDIVSAYHLVRLANTFTGITPVRDAVDNAMARMAASLFVQETAPGSLINIGIGLPEEVGRILFESGLYQQLTFTTESGVYGGMPVSGMYFGASINPVRFLSSAEMFRLYESDLEVTVLGFLEVDSEGNVNVSKRGPRVTDYVGPGGFPNLVEFAKTIIFIGKWSADGKYKIRKGKLVIQSQKTPKFVERVQEVSFNARRALARGARVYYVSTVGIFQLTKTGLELIRVMPGVDVERDVVQFSRAKIIAARDVPLVGNDLVTGRGFRLEFSRAEDFAAMAAKAKEREKRICSGGKMS
ncbi:MAG TPA: CoA-transferase [Smithella sp.]|nr:CoA-transferase [Smithella sp.]HRS96985.1 CoA-transferase [Smithella sp.]